MSGNPSKLIALEEHYFDASLENFGLSVRSPTGERLKDIHEARIMAICVRSRYCLATARSKTPPDTLVWTSRMPSNWQSTPKSEFVRFRLGGAALYLTAAVFRVAAMQLCAAIKDAPCCEMVAESLPTSIGEAPS